MILALHILMLLPLDTLMIYDFGHEDPAQGWYIVNDGVMGGLSQGRLTIHNGHAVFTGEVSLENYGGFTSIRYTLPSPVDVSKYSKISIRLRGDNKRYQLRLKADISQRHSYIEYFETDEEWEVITISLADLYATFRGQKLRLPNFDGQVLSEISILIANKKAESFKLHLDKIWVE